MNEFFNRKNSPFKTQILSWILHDLWKKVTFRYLFLRTKSLLKSIDLFIILFRDMSLQVSINIEVHEEKETQTEDVSPIVVPMPLLPQSSILNGL